MGVDTILVTVGEEDRGRADEIASAVIDVAAPVDATVVLVHVLTEETYQQAVSQTEAASDEEPLEWVQRWSRTEPATQPGIEGDVPEWVKAWSESGDAAERTESPSVEAIDDSRAKGTDSGVRGGPRGGRHRLRDPGRRRRTDRAGPRCGRGRRSRLRRGRRPRSLSRPAGAVRQRLPGDLAIGGPPRDLGSEIRSIVAWVADRRFSRRRHVLRRRGRCPRDDRSPE